MQILVFNCGSSSLNFKLFAVMPASRLAVDFSGKAHRVGVKGSQSSYIEFHYGQLYDKKELPIPDHRTAANLVFDFLAQNNISFDLIGHRFVHGGETLTESIFVTESTISSIMDCLPLASIHNPNSFSVIEVCGDRYPNTPQYLTFDTAFHSSLPASSYTYPLPATIQSKHHYRKYGFHGLSYKYVTQAAAEFLSLPLDKLKIIASHLGTGGSSVAAIKNGKSIDTSMGYTPLAGLMMSTRTGDLDALIPLKMLKKWSATPCELNDLFNKKSGLLGVSGFSSDIRDILDARDKEKKDSSGLSYDLYCYRLRKQIGAYAMLLQGLDVLIFTDDIGAQNSRVREAACSGLAWFGIDLDQQKNLAADSRAINQINKQSSPVIILAMPTDEESIIAEEGVRLFAGGLNVCN
jgi:acetate kinase